jgi:threonine/homoserine/homoserine lactone efflux protein
LGHSVIATLGLGALLAASELAYSALKYAGAAYLVYLGVRLLLSGGDCLGTRKAADMPLPRLFAQGALSNLSNPKIVLFYFAFLPQFVPASADHPSALLFLLGVLFSALTFAVKGPVGLFAGALSDWFRSHPSALAWLYRGSGMVLIAFALRLALEERH